MRIIASVQSKRGSSRGLVHYLAHSKIDLAREHSEGRELFNAFSDQLSVRSTNNFLKSECGKARPSNSELHHLVFSFRKEDYERLGSSDRTRKTGLRSVVREAMDKFEEALKSDRLAWAGAIHLNTANPHVHIAIQKQFIGANLTTRSLNKIPREALPHFAIVEGEKKIVDGIFIAAANARLAKIISEEDGRQIQTKDNNRKPSSKLTPHQDGKEKFVQVAEEREILRKGMLAEYQLKFNRDRINSLIENRTSIRFSVINPETGRKDRLSIDDLAKFQNDNEPVTSSQLSQIKAITHSILAKEEFEYFKLEEDTTSVRSEAREIRSDHRRRGTRLPTPAFRKSDLDGLQNHCLASSRNRDFAYLQRVRIDLEERAEIHPRTGAELESLAGRKVLEETKAHLLMRQISDVSDQSYYRHVSLGNGITSLANIDRETKENPSLVRTLRTAIESLGAKEKRSRSKSKSDSSRMTVEGVLNEQIKEKQKEYRNCFTIAKLLSAVLDRTENRSEVVPKFSANELFELEALTRKLKSPIDYARYWEHQKNLVIEPLARHISTNKTSDDTVHSIANEPRVQFLAGRAAAREVLTGIDLNKAKEDLAAFRKSKRYHKFAIEDKKDGSVSYLSLNDVDLSPKASVLDLAFNRLLEGKDHRTLRRAVERRVVERESRLKDDLTAAKVMAGHASREAAAFQQSSFGLHITEPETRPILTPREVIDIERRIETSLIRKEVKKLSTILADSTRVDANFSELLSRSMPDEKRSGIPLHGHSNEIQTASDRKPPTLVSNRASGVPHER